MTIIRGDLCDHILHDGLNATAETQLCCHLLWLSPCSCTCAHLPWSSFPPRRDAPRPPSLPSAPLVRACSFPRERERERRLQFSPSSPTEARSPASSVLPQISPELSRRVDSNFNSENSFLPLTLSQLYEYVHVSFVFVRVRSLQLSE